MYLVEGLPPAIRRAYDWADLPVAPVVAYLESCWRRLFSRTIVPSRFPFSQQA